MDSQEVNFCCRILKKRIPSTLATAKRWILKKRIVVNAADEVAEDGSEKGPESAAINKHYKILKPKDIRHLVDNDISIVSSRLSVSRGLACTLLRRNNWSLSSVCDKFFADEEKARKPAVGILANQKSEEHVCKICYNKIRRKNIVSAACGHAYCLDCWKMYISRSINRGPGCLELLCPSLSCKATLEFEFVSSLASANDKDKYYYYLYRTYVEHNKNRKWCPGPGCDLAIEFDGNIGGRRSYEVTCDCSYKFCWNCTEASHRPVNCKTAADWLQMDSSEAENSTWKLTHTKPCPKCFQPIEKNQGCDVMTCISPCCFQFCWVCLRPRTHEEMHRCCSLKRQGVSRHEKGKKNFEKKSNLDRYRHYYERWDWTEKSRKRALVYSNQARIKMLPCFRGKDRARMQFVVETWEQIAEFRRVLKWTYVYGYYLSLENSWKKLRFFFCLENSRNMNYFRFLLRKAEDALESLQHCAGSEMGIFPPLSQAEDLRLKLAGLTEVARNYFEDLVIALENNPCEVES